MALSAAEVPQSFAQKTAVPDSAPTQAVTKTETPQREKSRWILVEPVGTEITHLKKEMILTPETAIKMFSATGPRLASNWRDYLSVPPQVAPNAREVPEAVAKFGIKPRDVGPHATVVRFSNTHLVVAVLQSMGGYLWHNYYDCQAVFVVPRNTRLNTIFGLATLERIYGATHKGLRQGSSEAEVVGVLGKPDHVQVTQAAEFYKYFYEKGKLTLTFWKGGVQEMEKSEPQTKTQPHN